MSKKLKVKKNNFLKIMSCYDATSANIANLLGCDAILVGDSTGILNLGYKNTTDVNLKDLIENEKFKVHMIFGYFLTFLIFSNFYYN